MVITEHSTYKEIVEEMNAELAAKLQKLADDELCPPEMFPNYPGERTPAQEAFIAKHFPVLSR